MDTNMWMWYEAADDISKHTEVSTYHSLTGNEWIDLLICVLMLAITCGIPFYLIIKK